MSDKPWILGLSCSHNGSACLLRGDEIVVAIQEERLSRLKRHNTAGRNESLALKYCFDYAGIDPSELSLVVHSSVEGVEPFSLHDVHLNPYLKVIQNKIPVLNIPHHFAHAVSVFATSGFDDSAILVVDGRGSPAQDLFETEKDVSVEPIDEACEIVSLYSAEGTAITPIEKHLAKPILPPVPRPKGMGRFWSLGLMFNEAALQIFGDVLEAGKVMGLAPYGRQEFPVEAILEIIDGRLRFYDHVPGLFQHNDRWPERKTEYQNLACSMQLALEHALLYLVSHLRSLSTSKNLCYSGGVALNSIANERIIRESGFENVYIMPAAEDSGPAIGAAYYGLWQLTNTNNKCKLRHDALGRAYSLFEIEEAIRSAPSIEMVDSQDAIADAAELLAQGKIIGWFQGRSELGPRALGQRSILSDPRSPDGKDTLNLRVKHREAFRPFAPAILLEETPAWFDLEETIIESPFMLRVCRFKEEVVGRVPAVAHVDATGRLQTLTKEANGPFYDLVKRFFEITGVPIVLNTSFNLMGEPIVESPEDALFCLLSTGLDYCVLENKIVTKKAMVKLSSADDLLDDLNCIRGRLGDLDHLDKNEREEAIDAAMIDAHEACAESIANFRREVISHLGCVTNDMKPENAARAMRDLVRGLLWEQLEEESASHLTTAGLVNSMFMRYRNRPKDWSGVTLEIVRALQVEFDRKLMRPFIEWATSQEILDRHAAASLQNMVLARSGLVSLEAIYRLASGSTGALTGSSDRSEIEGQALFAEFASLLSDQSPVKALFDSLSYQVGELISLRDDALKHPKHNQIQWTIDPVSLLNLLVLIRSEAETLQLEAAQLLPAG